MHITKTLPLIFIFASSVSARCFTHGDEWGDRQVALDAAVHFCKKIEGPIEARGSRYGCYAGSARQHEFSVYRRRYSSRTILWSTCFELLEREIKGCERGGSTNYHDWRIT